MAWNRPENGEAASSPLKGKGGASAIKRRGRRFPIVVAGAIVALCAAITWFLISDSNGSGVPRPAEKKVGRIKEVKPAPAPKAKHEPVRNPDVDENGRPTKIGQIINGWVKLPSGRMHKVYGVHTAKVQRVSLIERTFEQPVDQDIAQLLTLAPGSEIVGESSDYYENFKDQFLETCKTPIVIENDDSEEVKLLKQTVLETRKELQSALDRGEDLTKIMRESREQLRELGLYKDEIHRQVKKVLEDGGDFSEADIKDLRDAANLMLEERGISPLHLDTAVIYQARKQRLEELQEAEQ